MIHILAPFLTNMRRPNRDIFITHFTKIPTVDVDLEQYLLFKVLAFSRRNDLSSTPSI